MERFKSLPCWAKVCVGGVVAVFFFNFPESSSDWASWVAAVGTLLAVTVALLFGLADARHRQQERISANGVYQWLFMVDIGLAEPALKAINEFLDRIENSDIGYSISAAELNYVDYLCGAMRVRTINAHINGLIYLPPDLGQALARVASNGPVLIDRIQLIKVGPVVTDHLKKYIPQIRDLVEDIQESISAIKWG